MLNTYIYKTKFNYQSYTVKELREYNLKKKLSKGTSEK
jgi:hypothetical protein